MNINEAIQQFRDYMIVQKGFSPKTITAYSSDLTKFADYLANRDNLSLVENIKTKDIVSYLSFLTYPDKNKKPILVVSRARKIASIKSFFNFLRKRKIIEISPAEDVSIPKIPQKEPSYLTINEYQKLLTVIAETASPFFKMRDLSIVSLFISTGIRVSELVNLKLSDIDFDYETIKVTRKGGKEQTLPINKNMVILLKDYLEIRPETDVEKLFISKKGNGVRSNTVYCLVRKYLELAGLEKNKKGPHVLRHSCLTALLSKGVDLPTLQIISGHNSILTTARYLHIQNKQIREAITKIDLGKEKQ